MKILNHFTGKLILEIADLRGADLRGANLRGADLRGADLRGADLDFSSGISFSCKGTNIKGDKRLFSQMIYHLTRQRWQDLTDLQVEWLQVMPDSIKNGFCEYRPELEEI